MYFKITNVGEKKYEDMGMVNVDAAFYLEEGDDGFAAYMAEHHVQVPVIPEGGYPGKVDKEGIPLDQKDFAAWMAALPKVWQLNPFCNHSMQFEASATEEEILYCFEWGLAMTHANYLKNDLQCKAAGRVVNQPINYSGRKSFYEGIKSIPEAEKTPTMKLADQLKTAATAKVAALKEVDFKTIQTVGEYKVG